MKILVTGATGFVGNEVIKLLVKTGNTIIATSIENDIEVKSKFDWYTSVKYIQKNLDDADCNFYEYFDKPDKIIHLSWANLPNYKELFHIEINLMSNYLFIKNLVENGIKDVICIGTCFEYGLREGCLNEDMDAQPCTVYGLAKDTLRKFIEELQKKYEFNFRWLRLFYPYGERQGKTSLLSQLQRAISNNEKVFNMSAGEQLRDYIRIEEAAELIVKCSMQNKIAGIINVCSGVPISVRKLVENYLLEKNVKIDLNLGYYPYPDYEPMAFWGDTKKLRAVLEDEKSLSLK